MPCHECAPTTDLPAGRVLVALRSRSPLQQVFSLAKYLMPGMMALAQLGMVYGVVLQLGLRPETKRQEKHDKRKQVTSADRT